VSLVSHLSDATTPPRSPCHKATSSMNAQIMVNRAVVIGCLREHSYVVSAALDYECTEQPKGYLESTTKAAELSTTPIRMAH